MGYFFSKEFSINYFHTLPSELRLKLCSYFTDILDISEVLKITILNNNVYDAVTTMTGNSHIILPVNTIISVQEIRNLPMPSRNNQCRHIRRIGNS